MCWPVCSALHLTRPTLLLGPASLLQAFIFLPQEQAVSHCHAGKAVLRPLHCTLQLDLMKCPPMPSTS